MALKVIDANVFTIALQSLARFVEKAHFDFDQRGVRIRSIDPHDFCYADITFKRSFFDGADRAIDASFGVNVQKFARILPALGRATEILIGADENGLTLGGKRDWAIDFRVSRLLDDPYDLPEPNKVKFEGSVILSSGEFCELTDAAAAVSNDMIYRMSRDKFWIEATAGTYQFSATPSKKAEIRNRPRKELETHVIATYVRSIEPLIKKCENVELWLGDHKPVKLDLLYSNKGVFSFTFSPQKKAERRRSRGGVSLPRLTVSKFPEFLLYLANSPSGEELQILKLGHLETAGGDYTRLGKILGLVERTRRKVGLAQGGIVFADVLKSDRKQAAILLNKLLLKKIVQYRTMIRLLERRPMDPTELYRELNSALIKQKSSVDKQDVSTLLGLAMWCNVIDRKMSLYYFGKPEERPSFNE